MKITDEMINIKTEFNLKFNPMDYCNGCGIGIGDLKNTELGISLYFETQENLDKFPYKEDRYKGMPIYRRVIGTIVSA